MSIFTDNQKNVPDNITWKSLLLLKYGYTKQLRRGEGGTESLFLIWCMFKKMGKYATEVSIHYLHHLSIKIHCSAHESYVDMYVMDGITMACVPRCVI